MEEARWGALFPGMFVLVLNGRASASVGGLNLLTWQDIYQPFHVGGYSERREAHQVCFDGLLSEEVV